MAEHNPALSKGEILNVDIHKARSWIYAGAVLKCKAFTKSEYYGILPNRTDIMVKSNQRILTRRMDGLPFLTLKSFKPSPAPRYPLADR